MGDEFFMLSREEVYYLMKLLGGKAMIGLGAAESMPAVLDRGRASLIQRGLVTAGLKDEVGDGLLPLAMASFFPDGALVVVRDIPEIGKQVLFFFRRGALTVLHTFPEQSSHRLAPLDSATQAIDLIQRWFPLTAYPQSGSSLLLTEEVFEELRERAEAHQKDAALQIIVNDPLPDAEKVNLIEAIEYRTISGSFAAMQCTEGTITSAYSVAIVAGPTTAWLISQPEDDSQKSQLLIRRIGADFKNVVMGLVRVMSIVDAAE